MLADMFLTQVACGSLQANCYVVAPDGGTECILIDVGMEAYEPVTSLVARHGLNPLAVLATHGHCDHVADAARVANHYGVPVWIHSADLAMLTDPASALSWDLLPWLAEALPDGVTQPEAVEHFDGRASVDFGPVTVGVTHAPGHTPGCVLLTVADAGHDLVFTGDVLFAGSVGRSDFPESDPAAMMDTLRGPVLSLPDSARILPGHGLSSDMARERAANPYLRAIQSRFMG